MWTVNESSPMWTSTQKIVLEFTDVILSSHAQKLAYFLSEFRLCME